MKNKIKKEIDIDKIQEKQKVFLDKVKKHHLFMWLILFFPFGIFISFKHKILPKWLNIVLTIIAIILTIAYVDTYFNPTRVADNKTEQNLENFSENIGTIENLELYNIVENTYIYDVITNKGRYDVFIDSNFDILSIKETYPNNENIYNSDKFNSNYKDIYSPIIEFLNSDKNTIITNFDTISVVETGDDYQVLNINNVNYKFNIFLSGIYDIFTEDENGEYNTSIYENDVTIRITDEISKLIAKRTDLIPDFDYCAKFELLDDGYGFIFYSTNGNQYEIIKHNDGSISILGASNNDYNVSGQ